MNLRKIHGFQTGEGINYPWQTSCLTAIEMIATSGGKDFLAAVTPSGGKTILGLEYAYRTLVAGHIDIVAVLVPSIPIQTYWIDEAAKFPAPRRARGRMTFIDSATGDPDGGSSLAKAAPAHRHRPRPVHRRSWKGSERMTDHTGAGRSAFT
jgi:superfamily II DNA or RNA helicase